jgi:hypothetical protein
MELMFINGSNLHYMTSYEWTGKLVEEVVVAYFKEVFSIAWAEQNHKNPWTGHEPDTSCNQVTCMTI